MLLTTMAFGGMIKGWKDSQLDGCAGKGWWLIVPNVLGEVRWMRDRG